jgi:hypothetical protein
MGAGQSTTQKITNEITNKVKLSAESIAAASQSVTTQNINTMQDVTVYGDISIEQVAEVKAILDAYIESTQSFEMTQDMINDIAAKAAQEAPNLSLTINVQDIDQEIKNILNNEVDIGQVVRSTCDIAANAINENKFQNVIAKGNVSVKQKALADVTAKCLIANEQYAKAMQKISNKVQVASEQTVKDIITGIVALIVMCLIGLAVAKAAGSAFQNKKFIEAAQKKPTLWMLWTIPMLVGFGTLAALDCGGRFPLVPKALTFGIPVPPSACRNKSKKVDWKKCTSKSPINIWPFNRIGRKCETVRGPDGKPLKTKAPVYNEWGYYMYISIFVILALFNAFQIYNYMTKKNRYQRSVTENLNEQMTVSTVEALPVKDVPTDVIPDAAVEFINFADF